MDQKIRWVIVGSTAGVVLLAGIGFWIYQASAPVADQAVQAYVQDWQKGDYAAMYDLLSADAKQGISEADFVKRHQSIYEGIAAKGLKVQDTTPSDAKETKAADGTESFHFHVQMDTVAGPVAFDQQGVAVQEGRKWKIRWQPSFLFPKLKANEKVTVQETRAQRGEITDRHGNGLAVNEVQDQIGIVPQNLPSEPEQTLQQLAKDLHIETDTIQQKLKASWVKPTYFVPIKTVPKNDPSLHEMLALPGVTSQDKTVRAYPLKEAAAPLVGYVSAITAQEYAKLKDKGYREDDVLGKTGLEQILESKLRGQDGAKISIVSADGQEQAVIAKRDPVKGETVQTTIDAKVQQEVYQQLQHEVGAGVVMQPVTGELLAMVSTPSYDANQFVSGVTDKQWADWQGQQVFMNRFASVYPPGSAFKPITAAIALDDGTLKPDTTREIDGLKWRKDASWGDYYVTRVPSPFSSVDLQKALMTSDNIYFAQTALELGADRLAKGAAGFGFGDAWPGEFPVAPSQLYNDKIKNDIQLADSGYGQGEVLMSPLHVAVAYTALVNGGNLIAPQLVYQEGRTQGTVWKQGAIKPDVASLLTQDLEQVIENPVGTGYGTRIPGLLLAGKTGTAEIKQQQGTTGKEIGWFVAFDAEHPHVLVALMVENVQARGGSHLLAPMMKGIVQSVVRP